ITSLDPVAVSGLSDAVFSTDGFLGLPVPGLGTNYIVESYASSFAGNPSEFEVVGTQNGTAVTITPSATVGPRAAGVPFTITLNQGDVYQLKGPLVDLTG